MLLLFLMVNLFFWILIVLICYVKYFLVLLFFIIEIKYKVFLSCIKYYKIELVKLVVLMNW